MTENEVRSRIWNTRDLHDLLAVLNEISASEDAEKIEWGNFPVFCSEDDPNPVPLSFDHTQMLVLDPEGSQGPAFLKIVDRNW